MKRLISLLLALVIIAGVIPAMTFSASALTVSTGNAYIDKYLNMAMSVEGKTKSYFGFNRAWCDLFIGWPAEKTGMTDIIPPMSKCNYGDGIGNYIATHGGSFVYFYDDVARDCDYGVKMKESDYTPKPGDIVFLRSSSSSSMTSPTRWSHNAIVYEVTDSSIYVVHGNWSSQVVVGTRFSRTSAVRYGKYYRITGYARPAYPETSPDVEPENPILQVPGYMCVPDTTDNAVKLNITEATVPADLTCQIETTLPDEMADLDVTYTSGNTDVATVGENGLVTPVSEGETEITVKAGDDETTARTVKITVVKKVFDLLEAKPNDETAENYKEIFLHRYVYNEELKRDTLIEGEIPFRTDVSETEKVWSELKKTTTKPETSDELEIISTETSYNVEKWTAKTDISVYKDENMTEKVGTISSGETFSTYNRKIVSGNLVAETENGFIVVRTASSASKYATFIGTEFVTNEAWKTLTTLNVRSAPSTSGDYVTAYSKGTSVTVTEYSEDDKYLWGKTSKGWIALYNYSAAEYNAEKTSESSISTYSYKVLEDEKYYVYNDVVSCSKWQVAPITASGTTTVEKKTFYYGATTSLPDENKVWAKGLDISTHNGEVDFVTLKASGIDYVILRIGYGSDNSTVSNTGMDTRFEENYAAAKAAGLDVGVYVYSVATNVEEAIEEAKSVIKWSKGKKYEYPVYFDIESEKYQGSLTDRERTDLCLAFTETVAEAGYFPGIYASYSWLMDEIYMDELDQQYGGWVAAWTSSGEPNKDYSEYGMWQYSDCAVVNGVNGVCDINVSYIDFPTLIIGGGYNGFEVVYPEIENPDDSVEIDCDIDGDGELTAADLLSAEQVMLTGGSDKVIDLNLDGVFDGADMVILQMLILGIGIA